MSIPLYFALNCKEFVNFSPAQTAQLGFGFRPDGHLALPEMKIPGAAAVIHDALLPPEKISDAILDYLAGFCTYGCFFDFERPPAPGHASLLRGLQQRLQPDVPCFLPEVFLPFFSGATVLLPQSHPTNHWAAFCASLGRKNAQGWALELQPWAQHSSAPLASQQQGFLANTVCAFSQKDLALFYYDTQETLTCRLEIAEKYGCIAAIVLYREYASLTP